MNLSISLNKSSFISRRYRVSHIETFLLKWLWQIEIWQLDFAWRYLYIPEVWKFEFHQPRFRKLAKAGLNSLRQKGYHISVKIWIFDDPFHKKGPVLVILRPLMINPSNSVSSLRKWGCRGCWGQWGCRGCWGQLDCKGFLGPKNHYWGLQSHPRSCIH